MSKSTAQAIKTRQNKLTRRLKKLPDIGQAIFFLVAGLILGTVFTFGQQYWQKPIPVEEAIPVSAVMQDVRGSYNHRHGRRLQEILIRFEDYEQLDIGSAIASESLLTRLSAYPPGTAFDMLVHPNSPTILRLSIQGEEIISFDDAMARTVRENTGFFWLGLFMYLAAAFGAAVMILRLHLRRYD